MTLGDGLVELWHLPLDGPEEMLSRAIPVLDPEERRQYRRFATADLARAFALRRAARRVILARHLGCAPEDVTFETGPAGKPRCAGLAFSASHSGGRAVVAVARSGELGVDIERIGRADLAILADRALGPRERGLVDRAPEAERTQTITRLWCAKEAVVKAMGTGLDLGALPAIEVPDLGDDWVPVTAPAGQGGEWHVHTRLTADGYAIGLAARHPVIVRDLQAGPLLCEGRSGGLD